MKAEALALQSHDPLGEIVASIDPPICEGSILEAGSLEPGLAGKLKGKLMFGASFEPSLRDSMLTFPRAIALG